jgi:hypothetical protein
LKRIKAQQPNYKQQQAAKIKYTARRDSNIKLKIKI